MLDKIIHFSIKNKFVVGLLTLMLVGWGSYSVSKLTIDAVPDITNNQIQVITSSPALSAEDIERLVTFPIEQTMASIPHIEEIRSFSRFGLSVVTIVFKDNVDIYWARQQVNERLTEAKAIIPEGVGIPEMAPVTTGLGEIYQYVIHTKAGYENKYSAMELRTLQDWLVRRQLLGIEGVADVSSFGGYLKQYEIAVNPDQLNSMNVSVKDIFDALRKNNQNTGGAYIDKKPNSYYIRSQGLIGSIEDIEKIVVKVNDKGIPVLIRNVASVKFGHAPRYGAMTRNEQGEAVGGIVLMLKGENASEVIKRVKERMEQVKKNLPEGVSIETYLDRADLVNRVIKTVGKNLAEGALIVIFVLVLLLGNFRAGFIVASVIPLAMLFAISMMNIFGVSGNLMSLGAIDFGLIVDGAVIIVEATLHHLTGKSILSKYGHRSLTQNEIDEEVYIASSKIRSSAAFGEIIILIVYLPILALAGIEGKMFRPMAATISFAILGAFILSLTYVPMMTSLFIEKKQTYKENISDKIIKFFLKVYTPVLHFALQKKKSVMAFSLTLLLISLFVFTRLGGEFIPSLDEGDFAVELRVMQGSSMSQTIEASLRVAKILRDKFPEVKDVVGKIGTAEIPTDPMPVEACDLMVVLKDRSEWTSATNKQELAEKMAIELEKIPGLVFSFQQPIQLRFNELMTGARQDVVIKIYGEDLDLLSKYAANVGKIASSVEGAHDIFVESVSGQSQIVITFDRDKIALFGLNIEDVNQTIRTAFAGEFAGFVYEGEKRFDMVVRLENSSRQSINDVNNLYINSSEGHQIPLSQIASVDFKMSPFQIQRDDAKRRIIVGFNVRGRDVESIVKEVQARVDKEVKLNAGYFVTYGGAFKNLIEARNRLLIAVPLALSLILILLYFTFHSLKQSLLIFTAIPMSAIGGIFALWLRDMPFSISAGIGFIALFGVAVLNGIVLIGEFNRIKQSGETDVHQIIIAGTAVRMRPVVMTALVASLGFLPMALSTSAGAEVQKPLATVVIGGLITATLLTLVVLPVLYWYLEKIKKPLIHSNNLLIVLPFVLFFAGTGSLKAQKTIVNLPQAIDSAIKNNVLIEAGKYEIDYNKALKKSSFDIGKTSAMLSYGQYNSFFNDNNFTISQEIPFPTVLANQNQLYKALIQDAVLKVEMNKNTLIYKVKSAYYQLSYLHARQQLLERMDSIYTLFAKAAAHRFNAGESNILEKTTAETELMEIKNQIQQNEYDLLIYQSQLQMLMNSKSMIDIEKNSFTKISNEGGSNNINNNPEILWYEQQVEISRLQKKVEVSKSFPNFSLGYFNQSLIGYHKRNQTESFYPSSQRFIGFEFGISVPLWFRPYTARIRAAEIFRKKEESNYTYFKNIMLTAYYETFQEHHKNMNTLSYYENSALPNANLIIDSAELSFKQGEIGYVEYLLGLKNALQIKSGYLNAMNMYNQNVIKIEYLIGNKK